MSQIRNPDHEEEQTFLPLVEPVFLPGKREPQPVQVPLFPQEPAREPEPEKVPA